MADDLKFQAVDSTMIEGTHYDAEAKKLHVKFRSGGKVYTYHEVPPHLAEGLHKAKSAGKFLNTHIKGKFDKPPPRNSWQDTDG